MQKGTKTPPHVLKLTQNGGQRLWHAALQTEQTHASARKAPPLPSPRCALAPTASCVHSVHLFLFCFTSFSIANSAAFVNAARLVFLPTILIKNVNQYFPGNKSFQSAQKCRRAVCPTALFCFKSSGISLLPDCFPLPSAPAHSLHMQSENRRFPWSPHKYKRANQR